MARPTTDPEALRREIEQTRAQLGETVEALAARADVKARAQDAVDDAKQRVREAATDARKRMNALMDSAVYQLGRQRERLAALDPAARAALAAAALGIVTLVAIRNLRGRRSQ